MIACQNGHKEVVSLLLADSRIEVNKPTNRGFTPFYVACQNGRKEVVSLLLADMRIDVNKPNKYQYTPLWTASQEGHLPVVQLFLASGREVDTKTKSIAGPDAWNHKTAAEIARLQGTRAKTATESQEVYTRRNHNGPLIADLVDSFDADPAATGQKLRELPEFRDSFISDLFALVVFLCDDLLRVSVESLASSSSSSTNNNTKVARFFQIAQALPMELQMLLCNGVFCVGKNMILTKHSEPAFKRLGKLLARTESQ